jgi:hypothetical protein
MIDWCVAVAGSGFDCTPDTVDFEGSALNYVEVTENKFADNHTLTLPPPPPDLPPPADILYLDGLVVGLPAGTGNCQSDNKLIKTPTPKNPGPLIIALPDGSLPTCQDDDHGHDDHGHDNHHRH